MVYSIYKFRRVWFNVKIELFKEFVATSYLQYPTVSCVRWITDSFEDRFHVNFFKQFACRIHNKF